jgi:RNA polymerase sigma factor (sigma-70 family)
MATGQTSEVLQHLRRSVLLRDGAGLTDGQLLEDYLSRRDEAALAALVRRHGAMVWGVCRRVLHNHHDAEDAFQATFLVLVRKADSIVPREMVANWLYGVAHQTALKARATTARRRARERQVMEMPEPAVTEPELWHDLQPLLDRELSRLPDKYRIAIVLCDLEGRTRKEAARQLGVPEGTLAARLARARVRLAKRLARHGLAVSGGTLAAVLAQNAASASAPTSVVFSTIKAVSVYVAGPAAPGVISLEVAALTEGVLKTMSLTRFEIALAVLLVFAVLGAGVTGLTRQTQAAGPGEVARKESPRADKPKSDEEKLQGAWKVVRLVRNGEELGEKPRRAGPIRLYFKGEKVYQMVGELFQEEYAFTLDREQKPATIDLTSDRNGTTKAIYRLEGDKLTLCRPLDADMERPTTLASEADSNLELLVLERDPKAPGLDLEQVKAEQKARADRRPVVERLQKIMLALHAYHDDKGSFPAAAIFDAKDKPLLSWRVALLPYLDEDALYNEFKLDEPWDSPDNKKLLARMPSVYGDVGEETVYQVFTGDGTAFEGKKAAKFDDIRDGRDNTILVAVAARSVPWTKPADLVYKADKPLPKLGGIFKEGFHVAAVDGHVRFVPARFNDKALRALITIAGGESETFNDLLRPETKDRKKP